MRDHKRPQGLVSLAVSLRIKQGNWKVLVVCSTVNLTFAPDWSLIKYTFQETLIHFTSIIYLQESLEGGYLHFEVSDTSKAEEVRPVQGRLVTFTSGAENRHWVEMVKTGVRIALTMFWTCDEDYFIQI